MKITSIKQQVNKRDRYSIYIDGVYSFALSEAGLIESGISKNQELSEEQYREYTVQADVDKIYGKILRYITIRNRSQWEIVEYLKRKDVSPTLIDTILNKLSNIGLINDDQYARAFIKDRLLLRPTSRRKIQFELRKKHINSEIIDAALLDIEADDSTTLQEIISRKKLQSRYTVDIKLMQYLSRQGYNYGDIKDALTEYNSKQ